MTLNELAKRIEGDDHRLAGDAAALLKEFGRERVIYLVVATEDDDGRPHGIIRLQPQEIE